MPTQSALRPAVIELQDEILNLSLMVNKAILDGVQALIEHNENLARRVGAGDIFLNATRLNIEEACCTLLTEPQPVTANNRIVIGAVIVATNLERIGDHAAGIARLTLRMDSSPYPGAIRHFPLMAETAHELVEAAVAAFVNCDDQLAEATVRRDREIDDLYEQIYRELAPLITKDIETEQATLLMRAAYNLERIGERVTNICERTIYVVTGELKEFG